MRYLITGGAGFIGSHTADALVARGDSIIILDNLSTGAIANVAHLLGGDGAGQVQFVHGSVCEAQLVRQLVAEVDVVLHLAASVGVQLIVREPLETMMNNIRGTECVLDAASLFGTKVLVTSTSEIYGKNRGRLHEDADRVLGSPVKARWSYSTSKAVDEILAYNYCRERGLPTVVVRLFNCSGPRQTGAYGMVIPRFVQQALVDEDVTVFGDGTQSRCFCHVADVVDALLRVVESDAAVGSVFNVGSRDEITIRDLADLVIEMTGSRSRVRFVPYGQAYEPGFEDMQRRVPDISRIGSVVGWRPSRTLRDIVSDVVDSARRSAVRAQAG